MLGLRQELESVQLEIRKIEHDLTNKMYAPFGRKWESRKAQAQLDDLFNRRERLVQAIAFQEKPQQPTVSRAGSGAPAAPTRGSLQPSTTL